ncbi:TFIIH subunit TTDA/Tfb5, partial [Protomyces lactucae-debilis]
MPRAQAGVLIECSDPTVKQLILKLDEQAGHTILLEDLDAYRILVTKNQVDHVRRELDRLLEENTY